ncbi:MAG: serine hydrolase [Citrobacter freundii]|nr:MAG: serine hydrolase [Citrobacter freundii]
MKKVFLLSLCAFIFSISFSQKKDDRLRKMVEKKIQGFRGDIGIYIKNLKTGKMVMINADTAFPTASIVKIPIMLGIVDKMEKGELHYDSVHIYKDSLLYAGEDILGSFRDGEKIALKKIMMLMLTTSDNTASLWLQKLAGSGSRINQLLDSLGFPNTKVNSRTPGREEIRKVFGWGQTSPVEMGQILENIYRNKIFSPAACDRMMRCLGRNFWDENEGISMIPPYIEVFSKNGCVDASRNEAMIVNAPNNPYVFCIFTKNNRDNSWTHANEAWTLTREISTLLWEYFEPKDKWVKPGTR